MPCVKQPSPRTAIPRALVELYTVDSCLSFEAGARRAIGGAGSRVHALPGPWFIFPAQANQATLPSGVG